MGDGSTADDKKCAEISEYLQAIAKNHNRKAKEYNESKREDSINS